MSNEKQRQGQELEELLERLDMELDCLVQNVDRTFDSTNRLGGPPPENKNSGQSGNALEENSSVVSRFHNRNERLHSLNNDLDEINSRLESLV